MSYIDKLNSEKSKSKLQPIEIKHSGNVRCSSQVYLDHIIGGALASDEKSDRLEEILGWNHMKAIRNQLAKDNNSNVTKI